ncbi:MAG: lecithin retinol acyltransferase family protein [Roseiarcus sp.]
MTELPELGDHLFSPRRGFTHHGLYVGRERVIHYSGYAQPFKPGPVEEVTLSDFADGNPFSIKEYADRAFAKRRSNPLAA